MKISLDLPDVIISEILKEAKADGHHNKSAVIRKAVTFYLSAKSHEVVHKMKKTRTGATSPANV